MPLSRPASHYVVFSILGNVLCLTSLSSSLLDFFVIMQAAQQTEVYWMALARDIPFSQFGSNDLIRLAAGTQHVMDH